MNLTSQQIVEKFKSRSFLCVCISTSLILLSFVSMLAFIVPVFERLNFQSWTEPYQTIMAWVIIIIIFSNFVILPNTLIIFVTMTIAEWKIYRAAKNNSQKILRSGLSIFNVILTWLYVSALFLLGALAVIYVMATLAIFDGQWTFTDIIAPLTLALILYCLLTNIQTYKITSSAFNVAKQPNTNSVIKIGRLNIFYFSYAVLSFAFMVVAILCNQHFIVCLGQGIMGLSCLAWVYFFYSFKH